MTYSKWTPDHRLAPFVENIWIQENPADREPVAPTRILPVGRIDMVVQFGDPFVLVDGDRETSMPALHLTGQRTRTMTVRATGRTGIVLVNFRPWGGSAFFGPLDEHIDTSPDLGDFVGRGRADQLGEAVSNGRTIAERARAVERFLLERLTPTEQPNRAAVEAALQIRSSSGSASMQSLATKLGMSRRHFARVFRATVGMPPKAFAQVVRFQKAVCYHRLGLGWGDAAYACGYSDQAHLNHEVASLAGMTPTELEESASSKGLGRYFNTHRPTRFFNTIYV
jgi:AraC-like DNA-binding protein